MFKRLTLGLLATTTCITVINAKEAHSVTVSRGTEFGNGADTFVREGRPTDNYGSAENILIKQDSSGFLNRVGYIRFDLSSINTNLIEEAVLDLTYVSDSGTVERSDFSYQVFGLSDGNPGETWDESTINWRNRPIGADLLGTFVLDLTIPTGNIVSFSSPNLVNFLQADTNDLVTFIIQRVEEGNQVQSFASKELFVVDNSFAPPTLTTEVVPEPLTILGAGTAIAFGTGFKRKLAKAKKK